MEFFDQYRPKLKNTLWKSSEKGFGIDFTFLSLLHEENSCRCMEKKTWLFKRIKKIKEKG